MKRLLLLAAVVFALAGCTSSEQRANEQMESLEKAAVIDINKGLREKGSTLTCTDVELVQESSTASSVVWSGYATMSNGARSSVRFVRDNRTRETIMDMQPSN